MKLNYLSASLVLAFAIFASPLAYSDEHPTTGKEHPAAGKEHPPTQTTAPAQTGDAPVAEQAPAKAPNVKKKTGKKKLPPTSWNQKTVEKELMAHVNKEKAKNGGKFLVVDDTTGIARELTLEKVHTDKIVKLNDGTSFVCADFKDANGENVDIDFFMTATATGTVETVRRTQVHKVNGTPRYTYVQKGDEWVQTTVNR